MTTVNVYEAKARLSALLAEAEAGGDVVIARAGRPIVRLVPVVEPVESRRPGSARGRVWMAPDLDDVDSEIERAFLDARS